MVAKQVLAGLSDVQVKFMNSAGPDERDRLLLQVCAPKKAKKRGGGARSGILHAFCCNCRLYRNLRVHRFYFLAGSLLTSSNSVSCAFCTVLCVCCLTAMLEFQLLMVFCIYGYTRPVRCKRYII